MSQKKPEPSARQRAATIRGGRSRHLPADPSDTQRRIAAEVREAATAAGLVRADLRRELGIVDRRTINDRWYGEQPYSLEDLDALGRLLGTTFTIPEP